MRNDLSGAGIIKRLPFTVTQGPMAFNIISEFIHLAEFSIQYEISVNGKISLQRRKELKPVIRLLKEAQRQIASDGAGRVYTIVEFVLHN